MASLVGSRVERKEDKRFLTGKGQVYIRYQPCKPNICYFCEISTRKSSN